MKNEDRQSLEKSCSELENTLSLAGVRVLHDARDNYTTGWKFNDWELKVCVYSSFFVPNSFWSYFFTRKIDTRNMFLYFLSAEKLTIAECFRRKSLN